MKFFSATPPTLFIYREKRFPSSTANTLLDSSIMFTKKIYWCFTFSIQIHTVT